MEKTPYIYQDKGIISGLGTICLVHGEVETKQVSGDQLILQERN